MIRRIDHYHVAPVVGSSNGLILPAAYVAAEGAVREILLEGVIPVILVFLPVRSHDELHRLFQQGQCVVAHRRSVVGVVKPAGRRIAVRRGAPVAVRAELGHHMNRVIHFLPGGLPPTDTAQQQARGFSRFQLVRPVRPAIRIPYPKRSDGAAPILPLLHRQDNRRLRSFRRMYLCCCGAAASGGIHGGIRLGFPDLVFVIIPVPVGIRCRVAVRPFKRSVDIRL